MAVVGFGIFVIIIVGGGVGCGYWVMIDAIVDTIGFVVVVVFG